LDQQGGACLRQRPFGFRFCCPRSYPGINSNHIVLKMIKTAGYLHPRDGGMHAPRRGQNLPPQERVNEFCDPTLPNGSAQQDLLLTATWYHILELDSTSQYPYEPFA
jgi:hypothetical protein